jgi:hypothetical protein
MNGPKKIITKIEFVENLLMRADKVEKCVFCKYCFANYDPMTLVSTIRTFFADHCKSCIHTFRYKYLKKEELKGDFYWIRDEFKPLYEWENELVEGEKDG